MAEIEQNSLDNRLLCLYYNPYSCFSQKVLMALNEKNIQFSGHIINIEKNEQYEKWFLEINPTGELPVLQNGNTIVVNSRNIIDYIDSNNSSPTLNPSKLVDREKAIYFRNMIDSLPQVILTVGRFYHSKYADKPKSPFNQKFINTIINREKRATIELYEKAKLYPQFRGPLLRKAQLLQMRHHRITNEEEYLKVLRSIDQVLGKVETELSTHQNNKENWWLINENFTVADISLTIFLEHLDEIGFSNRFWGNNKRPLLKKYFERAQKRKSFKAAVPTKIVNFKLILIGGCIVAIIGSTITLICTRHLLSEYFSKLISWNDKKSLLDTEL